MAEVYFTTTALVSSQATFHCSVHSHQTTAGEKDVLSYLSCCLRWRMVVACSIVYNLILINPKLESKSAILFVNKVFYSTATLQMHGLITSVDVKRFFSCFPLADCFLSLNCSAICTFFSVKFLHLAGA